MPLFSCPICGWATTASLTQAVRAHELGVPDCDGVLRQVAYAGKRVGGPSPVHDHDHDHDHERAASRAGPDQGPES
jgi:hypothetical protein